MQKRITSLLLAGLVGLMVFPTLADAITKTVGKDTYSLVERENFDCDLIEGEFFDTFVNGNNLFYEEYDEDNINYYVSENFGTCRSVDEKTYYELVIPELIYSYNPVEKAIYSKKTSDRENVFVAYTDSEFDPEKEYCEIGQSISCYYGNGIPEGKSQNPSDYYSMVDMAKVTAENYDEEKEYYISDPNSYGSKFIKVAENNVEDSWKYYEIKDIYTKVFDFDIDEVEIDDSIVVNYAQLITYFEFDEEPAVMFRLITEDGSITYTFDKNGKVLELFDIDNILEVSHIDDYYYVLSENQEGNYNADIFDSKLTHLFTFSGQYVSFMTPKTSNYNIIELVQTQEPYETTTYELRSYSTLAGNNQTYSDSGLVFRFSGELSKLIKVLVNDSEVAETNFSKADGSTIITLKKEYLDTLEAGDYTLAVEYEDGGKSSAVFKINEKPAPAPVPTPTTDTTPNPDTVDNVNAYLVLGLMSTLGMLGTGLYIKKRHN